MTIYLDVIFLENIVINYIILYVTGIISKTQINQKRLIAGALIGAFYSIIYYVLNLKIYSSFIIKIILSIVIIYVAFNSNSFKDLLKKVLLFYLTSFVFGGSAIAIIYMVNSQNITIQNGVLIGSYTIKTVLIGIVIAYFTIILAFKILKTKISKKDLICEIEISFNNKKIKSKALIDTGNFLKEPVTNLPVIVMERTLLDEVLPKEILNNSEEILGGDFSKIPRCIKEEFSSKLKVIPYSSLGKQNGMLLGIKGENLVVYLKDEILHLDKAIIAIYDKSLTKRGEYRSLLGLGIIEK